MKKPLIGVTPLYDDAKESIWMLPGYMDVLLSCGALPLILPFDSAQADVAQLVALCDGFLFTGGQDVAPSLYGEQTLPACGALHPGRDALEQVLYAQAFAADKPIFGICRGLQFLNVMQGGTLYQDLDTQMQGAVSHRMQPPYDAPWHQVQLIAGTPLHALLGSAQISVNSCHHQGIRRLGKGLVPMAQAPDALVEAFYCPGKRFVQAVQWHPEFAWRTDTRQRQMIEAFVQACC